LGCGFSNTVWHIWSKKKIQDIIPQVPRSLAKFTCSMFVLSTWWAGGLAAFHGRNRKKWVHSIFIWTKRSHEVSLSFSKYPRIGTTRDRECKRSVWWQTYLWHDCWTTRTFKLCSNARTKLDFIIY
jgi:hypothetical protein